MAKTDRNEKPDTESREGPQSRLDRKPKVETKTAKDTKSPKAEVVQTLKVEITFPTITDLKQALGFDADGNLIIAVQFKARVDQYEIFRLVNLLKQPHGTLYAIIGSPQSAMDFKFDLKAGKVEIINAAKTLPKGTVKPKDRPQETGDQEPQAVKIHAVAFNHIPEEEKPYGVAIDYIGKGGSGEIHTVAGRGANPTEAVIAGVANCGVVPADIKQPFEIRTALEKLEPSPDCFKLIRVLDVGSFDEKGKEEGEGGE